MRNMVLRFAALLALGIGLAGCVVYEPAPGYAYGPPAVYGPPVYGTIVVGGGGGWHHWR